ncbi:hypothetical protein PFICI_01392 [Pestalotiopsis fici W106-1]|uniref:Uncharacterized protein n=1 Tax=Pestalotiopsis fici (strain W106-1 / CGMCC3.15140) TaxID=1229662 RepID=W3XNK6_PESFW|nr:uncharacterized protein PFICI_01392 [Pestalotiopsis fici W106-1]ETS87564.1 hypothetical protein PFICI_01392 [Pestalotiopsis fici W106-1]
MDLLDKIITVDLLDRVELIFTHDLVPIIAISVATYAFACWRDLQSTKKTAVANRVRRPGKSWRVQEQVLRGRANHDQNKNTKGAVHIGGEPLRQVSVLHDRAMHLFGEVGKEWKDDTKTEEIAPQSVTGPTAATPSVESEEKEDIVEDELGNDSSGEEVPKDPQLGEHSPSDRELQDDQDQPETIEEEGGEGRELAIDTELGLFQSARPRVSAYIDKGREHLRKAGSWFGLPEPHSPLNVLRKASRLEWALFMGLKDVTKSGVMSSADTIAERVKPSPQADLGRRAAFAHLDSLDWEEVLRANAYRMDEKEYYSLEDSIMAFLGYQGPTKFPQRPVTKQRTWPTPRERFAEGKRRRSSLMSTLTEEDIDDDILLDDLEETPAAIWEEHISVVKKRNESNQETWLSRDEKYKLRSRRLGLLRMVQEERVQEAQGELGKEKGETLALLTQADNIARLARKHVNFLNHAYGKALERESMSDDNIRYWENFGTGHEMDHFPEELRKRILRDDLDRKRRFRST